MLHSTKTTNFS